MRRRERKPASWEREIKRWVSGGSSSAGGQKSESWWSAGPWSNWTGRRGGKWKQEAPRAGGKEKQDSTGVAQVLKVHRTQGRDQVSYPVKL